MKVFKFKIHGSEYDVKIGGIEGNIADVEVNGTSYQVEIVRGTKPTKTPVLMRAPVPVEPGQSKVIKKAVGGYMVKAPLPGTILKVLVKEGDTVRKGDKLLIMEAMKMENNITAERDGIVSSIRVNPGVTVLQNDDLIELS